MEEITQDTATLALMMEREIDKRVVMALAVFKHFPQVKRVKAGLLFVIANAFPKAEYTIDDEPGLWQKWLTDYAKMKMAYETGVWNPRTSGLCKKHCVVLACPHNGRA